MVIMTWGGRTLQVGPRQIAAMSALGLFIEAETEDKEADGRTLKKFKSSGARTINMDVPVMAALGVDVRAEVEGWMALCAQGISDRLYIGGAAVSDAPMLLRAAQAENVEIGPGGRWKMATLKLEFCECKTGASSSSSSGGSKKKSVRKSSGNGNKSSDNSGDTVPKLGIIGSVAIKRTDWSGGSAQKEAKSSAQRALEDARKKSQGKFSKLKGGGGVVRMEIK